MGRGDSVKLYCNGIEYASMAKCADGLGIGVKHLADKIRLVDVVIIKGHVISRKPLKLKVKSNNTVKKPLPRKHCLLREPVTRWLGVHHG